MGIDTPETGVSPSDKRKSKERKRLQTLIEAALEKSLESGEDDSGVEMLRSIQQGSEVTPETVTEGSAPAEEEPMMTESVVEETPMEEPAAEGSGLMSRGGAV